MGCRRSCVTRKHAGQIRLRCSCKKTELIWHTFRSKHHFTKKKKKNLDQLFFYRRKNNIFQIILLVYDVTNSFSFEVLEEWIDKIRKLSDNYEERPLMAVVGNKCDMEHQRTVKKDRTHKFAADNGFPSHDVSARTGEAVKYSLNNKRSNILYFLLKKNWFSFQVSLCIVTLAAQILGVRLTKTDQDYHKPIIIAEIGDTVDMSTIHKVVKRIPTKKQTQIPFHPHLPGSKSSVCLLQ